MYMGVCIYIDMYIYIWVYINILSVYIPFTDRAGLPLHNTPFPGVLMKSIGAAFFRADALLTPTTCVG